MAIKKVTGPFSDELGKIIPGQDGGFLPVLEAAPPWMSQGVIVWQVSLARQ